MDGDVNTNDVVAEGRGHCLCGHLYSGAPIVEFPFVKDGEEGIEDGATRFEYFIEIGHAGLGQVVGSHPLMFIVLQLVEGYGAKQLVGKGEARQEAAEEESLILASCLPSHQMSHPLTHIGLGHPWRAQQQHMLLAQQRQHHQLNLNLFVLGGGGRDR